ncbi:MAG: CheW-like domain [Acidobacteriota bacterium]|nr:CheW-like domain [Acidobacteriota bacterium]
MAATEQNNATAARKLFVLRAGPRLFAVFTEEVEATAADLTPTPLPFAPHAVLGVVSLRGRIRTVIDPSRLPDDVGPAAPDAAQSGPDSPDSDPSNYDSSSSAQTSPRLFVALAGDEQLALACDGAEEQFEIAHARIKPPADPRSHTRGTVERHGSLITLLDPALLFDAATRGIERRRKRS